MSSDLHSEDIDHLAADYVAGDLGPEDSEAFTQAVRGSTDLRREVQFWQTMAGTLRQHGRPGTAAAPGPGFNEVLRRRLQRESQLPQPLGKIVPLWASGLAAALAVALLVVMGSNWAAPEGTHSARAENAPVFEPFEQQRIGIASLPIHLTAADGHSLQGLRVVRIQAGSHAERLGLRPGDVVLAIDDQSILCPRQFSHVIDNCPPGDTRRLTVYHPQLARAQHYDLALGIE